MRQLVKLPQVKVIPEAIRMIGGMDVVTPTMDRKPGTCRAAQNFEQDVNGGYRRIAGYERYDGRAKPSDATYTILAATITGAAALGDVVTGVTSAATGTIIALPGGQFVLTQVAGTFVSGEDLQISAVTVAVSSAIPLVNAASTRALDATYRNLAADVYRALIAAVPGSGRIRGVVEFGDVLYAFRDNVGATACDVYKSTSGGWSQVTLLNEVSFTVGGTATPLDGETLTQGGVTATVSRVVLQSGAWSGTAVGRFIIGAPSGGNFAAGAATLSGGATVTLSGVQTAITLQPGGRYECIITNFGGAVATKRIYGCDGVNRGFEFDGTVYVPIATGMTSDTPSHVKEHQKQLFFSFDGSAQHSAPGTPYVWSPVVGAGELALGDTITGFDVQSGTQSTATLAMFTRNQTYMLYGTGASSWLLVKYKDELGAYAHTIQNASRTMFLDDRGITDIRTAQEFGNFVHNALSDSIKPLLTPLLGSAISSCISRDRSQYRLFFSTGAACYMTMLGRKVIGSMMQLFPDVVRCIWSGERTDGSEAIYFGSDDGMVYQMEKGTSFDGDDIEYFLDLANNFSRSPRVLKHFRHATLEVDGTSYAEFNFAYSLGYGSLDIDQPAVQLVQADFTEDPNWDAFTWDSFYWDGQSLQPAELDMGGDAVNCSVAIRGLSDKYLPFRITSSIIHYTPRRLQR